MKRTWFALFLTLAMVSGATPPKAAAQSPQGTCPLTGYEPYSCYGLEPDFTQSCNDELLHPYCSQHDAVYDTELYGVGVEPQEPHYWDGYRDYLRGLYPYDYYDDTAELSELSDPQSTELAAAPEADDAYQGCPYDPYTTEHADSAAELTASEAPYEYPYTDPDAEEHVDPSYSGAYEYGYDEYGYDEYGYEGYGHDEYGYDESGYEGEDGYWEDGYWEENDSRSQEEDLASNEVESSDDVDAPEASELSEDYADENYDDENYDYAYDNYDYWYSEDTESDVDEATPETSEHNADTDVEDYAYEGYGYEEYDSDYDAEYGYEYQYGEDYQYEYDGQAEAWNSGVDDLYARQSDIEGNPQADDDAWFDEDAWNTFESTYADDSETTDDLSDATDSKDATSDEVVSPLTDAETWGEGDFYQSAQAPVTSELQPDYESQFDGTSEHNLHDPMDDESYWDEYEESWFDHNDGDYESDYQSEHKPESGGTDDVAHADDASALDTEDYWQEYSDYVEHPQHDVDDSDYGWQHEDGDWQAWENMDESLASSDQAEAASEFPPVDSPLPESYWPERYQPCELHESQADGDQEIARALTADYLLPYAHSVRTTSMHWLSHLTTPSQQFAQGMRDGVDGLERAMQRLNNWMLSQYLPPLEELHEVEWQWEFED